MTFLTSPAFQNFFSTDQQIHPTFTIIGPTMAFSRRKRLRPPGTLPTSRSQLRRAHSDTDCDISSTKEQTHSNMASRFVSGGTNEEPTERDEAWLKAQQEIEARRKATSKPGEQDSGKSLYETLQANKGDSPNKQCVLCRHTPLTSQDDEPRNKKPSRSRSV